MNQEIKQIDDNRTIYGTHDISENHAKIAKIDDSLLLSNQNRVDEQVRSIVFFYELYVA